MKMPAPLQAEAGEIERTNEMDYIRQLGAVRRIERESARRGYGDDCTIDPRVDCGTLRQQLAMVDVGLGADLRFHDLSTRDQQLVSRLIHNCVLGPRRQPSQRPARRRVV